MIRSIPLPHVRRAVWYRDEASTESYWWQPKPIVSNIHSPPDRSRLVGIYLTFQPLVSIGAIYETGNPEWVQS